MTEESAIACFVCFACYAQNDSSGNTEKGKKCANRGLGDEKGARTCQDDV